jgi:di/tricarboxylate transporter
LIGQTLRQAHFREKYGMTVLALWRGGRQIRTGLADRPLQFGDALLLQGPRERLRVYTPNQTSLSWAMTKTRPNSYQAKAVGFDYYGRHLALAAINSTLVAEVMLGGALLMVLARVLTMDQAYQSVEWKSVFLIAGMLPMGIAITKTGAAALLANGLIALLGPSGSLALLAGLFILTMLLTQVMNGAAVAAVMAPIAIQTAQKIGADPRSLAMGVALATSMAFMTPLGHAVNVLVMGPGGYRFKDYFKVGWPLILLLSVLIITLLPLVWSLTL